MGRRPGLLPGDLPWYQEDRRPRRPISVLGQAVHQRHALDVGYDGRSVRKGGVVEVLVGKSAVYGQALPRRKPATRHRQAELSALQNAGIQTRPRHWTSRKAVRESHRRTRPTHDGAVQAAQRPGRPAHDDRDGRPLLTHTVQGFNEVPLGDA